MNGKFTLKKLKKDVADTIKKQYFTSDILEVKQFLLAWGYEYDKYAKDTVTRGWRREKEAFLAKAREMVNDKIVEDIADKWVIDTTELHQMKHTTVQLLKAKLNELTFRSQEWINYMKRKRDENLNKTKRVGIIPWEVRSSEIIDIMTAIKRELGEPLTISKVYNTHDLDIKLTDEEVQIVDMLDTLEAIENINNGS